MEPIVKWTRKQALVHLKNMGAPWWARAWFSAKWILLRGRSVRFGRITVTMHDQSPVQPLRWQ